MLLCGIGDPGPEECILFSALSSLLAEIGSLTVFVSFFTEDDDDDGAGGACSDVPGSLPYSAVRFANIMSIFSRTYFIF